MQLHTCLCFTCTPVCVFPAHLSVFYLHTCLCFTCTPVCFTSTPVCPPVCEYVQVNVLTCMFCLSLCFHLPVPLTSSHEEHHQLSNAIFNYAPVIAHSFHMLGPLLRPNLLCAQSKLCEVGGIVTPLQFIPQNRYLAERWTLAQI